MKVTQTDFDWIQAYAVDNYEQDGWDYVVETVDLPAMQELADIFKAESFRQLFEEVGKWAKLCRDVEEDIQGS